MDRTRHDGGMTRSGQIPASPPAAFPVYGLDASWPGTRWLDSFGDLLGEQVRWVRLAHQSPESGAMIMVQTHSRPLTDAEAARGGQSPLQSVAFEVALVLVNLTLPAISVPRPAGLLRELVNHADERGKQYAQWSPERWFVDGVPVPARAWRFAGGWAAFSDAVDGVYLAAAGSDAGADGLALSVLTSGRAYNLDLDQHMHPGVIAASSAARAGAERLPARRQEWHSDQVRLMDEAGASPA
jgi:hypothetical protein